MSRPLKGNATATGQNGIRAVVSKAGGSIVAKEKGNQMGRMCEEKKRYETEAEAIRMGLAYTRHSGGGIRVYLCPICKGWHLTTHAEDGTSLKNEFAKS